MGVSSNGGFSPHFTPQVLIIFCRVQPHGFVGVSPTIFGFTPMSSNPWWFASGEVASKGVAAEPDKYRQTLQCIFSFGFSTSYRFQRGRDVFVVGESFFSLTSGWLGLFFFFSCFVWRLRMNYHFFSGVSLFWRLTIGFFLKLPIPGWLLVAKKLTWSESDSTATRNGQTAILSMVHKSGDHQLRLVEYPVIYKVLYIQGG